MENNVEGYVCNNKVCRQFGAPKYVEDGVEVKEQCPACNEDTTILIRSSRSEGLGEKINAPAVKLANKKYYG